MSAYAVGLTGGLASGKSTVAGLLRDAGFLVVDADRVVADLYRPEEAGSEAIRELFGDAALNAEGGVDHAAVARRIFADPDARHRLEAAIHPLVRQRFAALAADHEGIVVLEATLLVEAGFADDFDLVVTVEADPEVRLARAVARGLDESDGRARLAAQGDGTERQARADRVLRNEGTLGDLRRAVDALVADIRAASAHSSSR